jgi:hypothetical protein
MSKRHVGMALEPGDDRRRAQLQAELEREIAKAQSRAMTEYWLGQLLMIVTLVASAVPAVGGIFELFTQRQLGALATAPAGMAFVAAIFKFPAKANLYWSLASSLDELRVMLLYGSASDSDVAKVARRHSQLKTKIREEWAREFTISWAAFGKPHRSRH